ncbi:MAG: 8-oxoguanine deaminase, partial [Ruminococcus sp.]|nr:8-oxoguanine deaminase [Ruminococcus sp.]
LFLIDKRRLDILGAAYSPKTMLASVGLSDSVDYTIVNGVITVEHGHLKNEDEIALFEKAHEKIKDYLGVE